MSKHYYPNAIVSCKGLSDGKPFYQGTYDSLFSLGDALKCIEGWSENYKYTIYCAWIDDGNGNVLWLKNCTNAFGFTKPMTLEK